MATQALRFTLGSFEIVEVSEARIKANAFYVVFPELLLLGKG